MAAGNMMSEIKNLYTYISSSTIHSVTGFIFIQGNWQKKNNNNNNGECTFNDKYCAEFKKA